MQQPLNHGPKLTIIQQRRLHALRATACRVHLLLKHGGGRRTIASDAA